MDRLWLSRDMAWLLGSLCQINKLPFVPALFSQQHPPPHAEATFSEAAAELGFRVGRCDVTARNLADLTFPFVAFFRQAAAAAPVAGTAAAGTAVAIAELLATDNAIAHSANPAPAPALEGPPIANLALVIKTDAEQPAVLSRPRQQRRNAARNRI